MRDFLLYYKIRKERCMDSKFLLECRNKIPLSQKCIADELGYSPQMISLWESDKGQPALPIWSKYAYLLELDLEGFLFQKYQKKNDNCEKKKFDASIFSKNLKRLRIQNTLTQVELAKKVNVNNKIISAWESGASFPSIEQFIKLCKTFNTSFDDLYFGENNVVNKPKKKTFLHFLPLIICVSIILSFGATFGIFQIINNVNSFSNNVSSYQYDENDHWKLDNNGNVIEKEIHIFDGVKSKKETCLENGEITYTCQKCGYQKQEIIPKKGHVSDGTWHFDDEYHYHICLEDNVKFDITLHEFVDGLLIEEDGVKYVKYHCQVCEYQKSVKLNDYVIDNELLYFGSYPQKRVNDESLISILDSIEESDERGYYFYNDKYYYKEVAKVSPYTVASSNRFKDGTSIIDGKSYWFIVEPIAWKILEITDDYYLLFSNVILDAGGYLNPSNNYKDSILREYLNSTFYNLAFHDDYSLVLTSEVDNSLSSTKCDVNDFICDNTLDKVYVPSYKELSNVEYGLGIETSTGVVNKRLVCDASDYSKIKNMFIYDSSYFTYYTRSPGNQSQSHLFITDQIGFVSSVMMEANMHLGYRPMIKISH